MSKRQETPSAAKRMASGFLLAFTSFYEMSCGSNANENKDGDGRMSGPPELIVFHLDHPDYNIGYYRIGWDTNAVGDVTGWTAVKKVGGTSPAGEPDWFGADNSAGSLAVADLNNSGRPELVVFHLDHPNYNIGYYRVGWDVTAVGDVAGWTAAKKVGGTSPTGEADWFGANNSAGSLAVADLNNNGRPELIVFHLDDPGYNIGYYRIGWDVTAAGDVTDWTAVKKVGGAGLGGEADWFGAQNSGGNMAVADLNGNGRPELIVFHLDDPGYNIGYYRIGWDVSATGDVTDWTPVKKVGGAGPNGEQGWFGADNSAGSLAVADLNKNGRPELIVFHLDHPNHNIGYYRIGWDVSIAGDVTAWTAVKKVGGAGLGGETDWFGADNSGGGIALADLN